MKIAIVTDSTCDLQVCDWQKLDVDVVPLTVNFANSSFKDGYDENAKRDIYSQMRAGDVKLMTSQPSPEEFLRIFNHHKELGNDIIYIGISSKSSGTLQAAQIARLMCDYDRIHIIDSLQLSHGLQLLVRIACRLRDEGRNCQEIVTEIRDIIPKVRFITYVDNLKYLIQGGRVKNYTSHDNGRFNMKTLVSMIDGRFTPINTARGKIGAFEKIYELMQKMKVDERLPVVLTHADNAETMHSFENYLKSKGSVYNYLHSEIGSVIGSHMGPGTVGIAYIEK